MKRFSELQTTRILLDGDIASYKKEFLPDYEFNCYRNPFRNVIGMK